LDLGYERNDEAFLALMDAMVLGTTTFFNYDPSTEECKSLHARMQKIAASSLENINLPETVQKEMTARLKAAE
jgi:hypothetical protein